MALSAHGAWRAFVRAAYRLSMAANVAGTLSVLALVAIVDYDIVARGAFNKPFMGAVEVVQFSLVFIVFLQLPDVVRVDRLTRSDGFLLLLGTRYPRVARYLQRFVDALAALFMALVAWAIWPEFVEMWKSDDYFGMPGVFTAPWWPIKLVIFASGLLCTVLFLIKLVAPDRSPYDIDVATDTAGVPQTPER